MLIEFTALGLNFQADVNYCPGRPAQTYGPPENCYPEEYPELEFNDLNCEGKDASFLLESTIMEDIETAAYEVAGKWEAEMEAERAEAEYEFWKDERNYAFEF